MEEQNERSEKKTITLSGLDARRGKELLAIVGDHSFCQEAQGATNPLRDVIDYIRRNPQTCALEEVKP